MARPVKWSRDLHPLRERAARAFTETWSRQDLEALFGVGRASAQSLMKAIGDVQTVAGAHFVQRPALVAFLDTMIAAPSVEEALRPLRLGAAPAPKTKTLRVSLPDDLRRVRLPDLPADITLAPGWIEITAETAAGMLQSLLALAMVMQTTSITSSKPSSCPRCRKPQTIRYVDGWADCGPAVRRRSTKATGSAPWSSGLPGYG